VAMMDDLISVSEIARAHSRRRQSVHKIIKRLGLDTRRFRSDDARGQEAVHITRTDYALLAAELVAEPVDEAASDDEITDWRGILYIVQLEPSLDPGRFKIGFTNSIEDRLKAHRTSAPFATALRHWPCRLLWEKTAIEAITQDCEKLHTEVFRAIDIATMIERADRFFALMPRLKVE
jgi:hypothetical protein